MTRDEKEALAEQYGIDTWMSWYQGGPLPEIALKEAFLAGMAEMEKYLATPANPIYAAPQGGMYNVSVGGGSAYGISSEDIQESINELYAGILKERPTTTITKPCVHEWKTYKGLSYQEDYCDSCGKTQNRRGLFE